MRGKDATRDRPTASLPGKAHRDSSSWKPSLGRIAYDAGCAKEVATEYG